jgi:xanthine dehydrogenase accessory factor
LHLAGIKLIVGELEQPLAVRRTVSFAEAIYAGQHTVEGVTARCVEPEQILTTLKANDIPVLIDPDANILTFDLQSSTFVAVIDGRLIKQPPAPLHNPIPLHIGLGPGFHAGINCDAVIETRRSHTLGRVYWNGATQPDSGQPEGDTRRVLRAPSDGVLIATAKIGEHVEEGQEIARIQVDKDTSRPIHSPFAGVLRGLIHEGIPVTQGMKIGDIDPRDDASACFLVSDKALSIGGAVLEAILTRQEIREKLWK